MKFRVTMKDPDVLDDAIQEAVKEDVAATTRGLFEQEVRNVEEDRVEQTRAACSKWFKHGECLTVEVDTEAGTCVVVPK